MTIVEFLLAGIAEDEAVVQEVRPTEYLTTRDRSRLIGGEERGYGFVQTTSGRILAECEAKRRIVALHQLADGPMYRQTDCCARCTASGEYPADDAYTDEQNWPCPTLRALAAVYADRPGYDQAWAL